MSGFSRLKDFVSRNKKGVTLGVLLAFSSTLILFNGTPGIARPQEIGMSVFSVFQNVIASAVNWVGQTFNSIDELRRLREEFERAKSRVAYYEGIERSVVELRQENKALREQLQFSQQLEFDHIPVQIIAKDPASTFSSIMVNKGFADGIRKDMPVVAYQEGLYGLVGKVVDVGLASALIQPILDSSSYIAARFQSIRYEGLVVGKGSSEETLSLLYVKKRAKDEIKYGDLIISSGMKSLYPKGIYIGRVKSISSKDYENSLEVELDPVISFSKLEYLYILKMEP